MTIGAFQLFIFLLFSFAMNVFKDVLSCKIDIPFASSNLPTHIGGITRMNDNNKYAAVLGPTTTTTGISKSISSKKKKIFTSKPMATREIWD